MDYYPRVFHFFHNQKRKLLFNISGRQKSAAPHAVLEDGYHSFKSQKYSRTRGQSLSSPRTAASLKRGGLLSLEGPSDCQREEFPKLLVSPKSVTVKKERGLVLGQQSCLQDLPAIDSQLKEVYSTTEMVICQFVNIYLLSNTF